MNYWLEKRVETRLPDCKDAQPKPMAAYWYEQDVAEMREEIERLEAALSRALWRAA